MKHLFNIKYNILNSEELISETIKFNFSKRIMESMYLIH